MSVDRLCPVPLSEGQRAALIDFAFNLGAGNLQASTLRKMTNRGDMEGAAREFPKWVYAGGVKLPGLVRRRAAEAEIFGGSHV
jgi:lysozyme